MTAACPAVVFHMVTILEIKDQSLMTIIVMFPNETRRCEILLSLSLCIASHLYLVVREKNSRFSVHLCMSHGAVLNVECEHI